MFYVEQYWCTCVHYQQRQPRSARIMVDFEADRPKSIQMLRSPDRKIYNTCGVWLSSSAAADGGWGGKCSCCCKCIFIYYPKKKYLPQGASRVLVPRVLGFIFSYVLIFQVYRWVRCYGLGLFSWT